MNEPTYCLDCGCDVEPYVLACDSCSKKSGAEMIEMRWLVEYTPQASDAPRLQMRFLQMGADASGALSVAGARWSDWKDIPVVKTRKSPQRASGDQS